MAREAVPVVTPATPDLGPMSRERRLAPCESPGRGSAVGRLSSEFDDQLRRGWHRAAQLVLLHDGRVVLERSGGAPPASVTATTPFLVCSIGKTVLALCIHHLVDRRVIELDAPVSRFWPEFAAWGKERCTIRHVLLHQTGLSTQGLWRQLMPGATWDGTLGWLARARPARQPAVASAYEPLNSGFILGEILRRVTGVAPQAYLERHFLRPMGLAVTSWSPSCRQVESSPRMDAGCLTQLPAAWLFNRRYLRRRLMPAFNLVSTAHELAALFLLMSQSGVYGGRRYLSTGTVDEAIRLQWDGVDRTIGRRTLWALGFHLGGRKPEHAWRPGPAMGSRSSVRTFGHCAHMSSIAWADPDAGIVFAFTCNGLLSPRAAALRWQRLADLAWDAVEEQAEHRR
jgi:CubicO group peptidase (beta-lactamase class C family)